MAQNADYQKLNWQDLPSEVTPLSAANLNRMEDGIEAGANFRLPGKLFDSSEDLDEYLEISSDGSAAGQTVTALYEIIPAENCKYDATTKEFTSSA